MCGGDKPPAPLRLANLCVPAHLQYIQPQPKLLQNRRKTAENRPIQLFLTSLPLHHDIQFT